jgi:hypothetical protein
MPTKKSGKESTRHRVSKGKLPGGTKSIRLHNGSTGRARATGQKSPRYTLGLPGEEGGSSNGTHYEYQKMKNPEDNEEREKRLKKREALTLKAFQIAYENHHQRKAS